VKQREHTEHGRERKQELVDAAAALFAAKGYGATRVSDICCAAGVAKGLFYWYFPTKRDLFAELVRSMRLALRRAQAAAMADDAPPLQNIASGTAASVRFIADHATYFALLDAERREHEVADVLAEGAEVYLSDVRDLIIAGQATGEIIDADPHLLAVGVVGAVSSYTASYRSGRLDRDLPVDQLATFVSRWVTNALT
jgi:AcrR family transcriptional regulator